MRGQRDAFGRPVGDEGGRSDVPVDTTGSGPSTTSEAGKAASAGAAVPPTAGSPRNDDDRSPDEDAAAVAVAPAGSRGRVLLGTLLAAVVGVGVTVAFAVDWARDLPKTVTFAIVKEPFGERSLLQPDNARAGLRRVLARLPAGDRIAAVTLNSDRIGIRSTDAAGRVAVFATTIQGDTDGHRTQLVEPSRGISAEQFAKIDLDAALRAARERWAALDPSLGRVEGPMVQIDAADGDPRAWTISFPSPVPSEDRSSTVDLQGRPVR